MKDNVVLYQFPTGRRVANPSVFCMKLETFLKVAEIPYTVKPTLNMSKAPARKLPYVEIGDLKMSDSSLIIHYLVKQHHITLDDHLTEKEKALSVSIQRMLEESYYFAVCWSRWLDPVVWPKWSKTVGASIPKILRKFVLGRIQKKVYRQLYEQGTARLNREAIYEKANAEMDALSEFFSEGPYFFKDHLTSIDTCIYAFCALVYTLPQESALREHFIKKENLVKFLKFMHEKYYPNFTL
jgi:glutathione S-transferase